MGCAENGSFTWTVDVTVGGSFTFSGSGSSRNGLATTTVELLVVVAVGLLVVIADVVVNGGVVVAVILALTLVSDFDSDIAFGSNVLHTRTTPFSFWSWGWSWDSHSLASNSLTGGRFALKVGKAIAVA